MNTHIARNYGLAALSAKVVLGASLALGFGSLPIAHADQTGVQGVQEGSPQWSCVDDGNRVCGPNNPEGQPAACYDEGGVIVALWPCHVVVNPDGSSDVWDGLSI